MSAARIRQTLKRVRDPTIRERLLMVQDAYEMPLRDAAKRHGCTHGKIDFWKKRYEAKGLRGLSTKERPGRPSKLAPEQTKKLRRTVRKHNIKQGWRTKHVRQLIKEEADVTYTQRHTIRLLHKWGLAKIVPRPRYAFSKEEDRDEFIKKTSGTWHVNPSNGESS
jgi:transposase